MFLSIQKPCANSKAEALPGILLPPHDEETLGKTLNQAKG